MASDHDNLQAIRETIGTGGTGGPASIANGADVAEGATTDAAVVTDANGTLSGKLRGLVKWAFERMPAALGQQTRAASLSVTQASDATGANSPQMQGAAAKDTAVAGNPVYVAGTDGGTNVRAFTLSTFSADGINGPSSTANSGLFALAFGALFNGATWDRRRTPTIFKDLSAVDINPIATVWTPAAGKKFRLMRLAISASVACNVLFEDNAAGAGNFVFRTPELEANKPYTFDLDNGKLSAAANNVLKATSSVDATITGTLYGMEE